MRCNYSWILPLALLSCTFDFEEAEVPCPSYTVNIISPPKSSGIPSSRENDAPDAMFAIYCNDVLLHSGTPGSTVVLNDGFEYDLFVLSPGLATEDIPANASGMLQLELSLPSGKIPKSYSLLGKSPSELDGADGRSDGIITATLSPVYAKALVGIEMDNSIMDYYDDISVRSVKVFNAASTYAPFEASARTFSAVSVGEWDSSNAPVSGKYVLYLPENLQGNLLPSNNSPSGKTADALGVKATRCTYIEAEIEFNSSAGTGMVMRYRFYPGEDNTTNFDILRSRTYSITLCLSADGFNITGTWKTEMDEEYDTRRLYFSLYDGTVPSEWSIFDNAAYPLDIVINFSRDGSTPDYNGFDRTTFPYGYRLYVNGDLWEDGMYYDDNSGLFYDVSDQFNMVSVTPKQGEAAPGESLNLIVETIDGEVYDEIDIIVKPYTEFGYRVSGGADPRSMYKGQYSNMQITLGTDWREVFQTNDISVPTLQIRNSAGTSAVNGKFWFKNYSRLANNDRIDVTMVADAVWSGSLWIGNPSKGIWRKVTDVSSARPSVVYSESPSQYPANLADGDSRVDFWACANSPRTIYVSYVDSTGKSLSGPGTFLDIDGWEAMRTGDFIEYDFPEGEEADFELFETEPDSLYAARLVVTYNCSSQSEWTFARGINYDPDRILATVGIDSFSGNDLKIGLMVAPASFTLENNYVKTSAYTAPDPGWYLVGKVQNTSNIPLTVNVVIFSRWTVSGYVKYGTPGVDPFWPTQYAYVDSRTMTLASSQYQIYALTVYGHGAFESSATYGGSEMEFFRGETTSHGFTGTLREFMEREYIDDNYYVFLEEWSVRNNQSQGYQRRQPTYQDCDLFIYLSGEISDELIEVHDNLGAAAWPVVYGTDFYDLRHVYAYLGNDYSIPVICDNP